MARIQAGHGQCFSRYTDLWLQWEAKCITQGSRPWGPLLHPGTLPLAILAKEIGVQMSLAVLFLENSFLGLRDKDLEHCLPGYLLRKFLFEHILGSPAR